MVDRISALAGEYRVGKFGAISDDKEPGVKLQDVQDLMLNQVAAWSDTLDTVGGVAAKHIESENYPGPCSAAVGNKGALLRIEPLKWWVFGASAPDVAPEQGATVDLSHSRTHVRISGDDSVTFLNRHLSLDLREASFPVNSVASTVFHHVGITLWRSEEGYEMFIPRGFALSLWQLLVHSAEQFGVEVI